MTDRRMRIVTDHVTDTPRRNHYAARNNPSPNDVYLCGECGIILRRGSASVSNQRLMMTCYNCGTINEW